MDTGLPSWLELWIVIALVSSGIRTVHAGFTKWLTGDYTGLELAWATSSVGAICLLPFSAWVVVTRSVTVTPTVVAIGIVAVCIELTALYIYLEALSAEDLSVVSPLKQSVPVFVVVFEPILLGVGFDLSIAIGAVLAAVGAYAVLVEDGFFTPLARVTERGPKLALGAALLYAFASITAKFILVSVPPIVYAWYVFTGIAIGSSVLMRRQTGAVPYRTLASKQFVFLGVITAMISVTTFLAFSLAPVVSQVTIALRASILFNVAVGGILFNETGLLQKFAGSLLIIAGITAAIL